MQSIFSFSTLSQYTRHRSWLQYECRYSNCGDAGGGLLFHFSCSCLTHFHSFVALLAQLLPCGGQLFLGEVGHSKALDNRPLSIYDGHWEAEHDALGRAIAAIAEDSHTHPVVRRGAPKPALHVIGGRLSCRHCRAQLPRRDHSRSSLLNGGDKDVLHPGLVKTSRRTIDCGVSRVRELGGAVVAPDRHLLHRRDWNSQLLCDLSSRPVLIKPGHRREVLLGNGRRVVRADQGVGVGWVANNENLAGLLGKLVECLALHFKDLHVEGKQVLPLHSFFAGHSTNEESSIHILEGHVRIIGSHHIPDQRQRAVLQLHDDSSKGAHGHGDVEQVEDKGLVFSKDISRGNLVKEAVSDLAASSGDHNAKRSLLCHLCNTLVEVNQAIKA